MRRKRVCGSCAPLCLDVAAAGGGRQYPQGRARLLLYTAEEATVNNNQQKTPQQPERPESQPHGTTSDQIAEMESEGPGASAGQKGQAGQVGPVENDKKSAPQPK